MMGCLSVFPGDGRALVNLVPVDYVVDCLTTLPEQPGTAGKTFHLADPNPLTTEELTQLVAERLRAPRPRVKVPAVVFRKLLQIPQINRITRMGPEALDYFEAYQVFDTTHTRTALEGSGLHCPPLRSYLNPILRYYRDHAGPDLPWRLDRPA